MDMTRDVNSTLGQTRNASFFDDDVNGQIIGGEYAQAWVTYDGRKQGPMCYPCTHAEADAMCKSVIERIKNDCGDVFKLVYPDEKWAFHYFML